MNHPKLAMDILVVDDEPEVRELLADLLGELGQRVQTVPGCRDAIALIQQKAPDLVVTDLRMPEMDGIELTSWLKQHAPDVDVIIVTAYADKDSAIRALRAGVYDYLTKPLNFEELDATLRRVAEKHFLIHHNVALRNRVLEGDPFYRIVGMSSAMQTVYEAIRRISNSESNVLICGESGTGKELVARAIHDSSTRFEGPFEVVDCGAITESLMESDLYGHVKGAFTGAVYDKPGMFEKGDGGTVFLDEISNTSPAFQSRLLRVIQEREFRPVGSTETQRVDVRIISATNQSLERMVKEGTFREDLYYRLNVVQIDLPPLHQRKSDIPLLARCFLDRLSSPDGPPLEVSQETLDVLLGYDWPGNVRELENVIERAVAFCDGAVLRPVDLPERIRESIGYRGPMEGLTLDEMEKEYIRHTLQRADGHRGRAAEILGVSERTLYRKLRKYAIDVKGEG